MANLIPNWIQIWLIISGLVCLWDASFILLRPKSMPGGSMHALWKPYALYIEVDRRYQDMEDPFVYAVSLMNLVEVVLTFLAVYLCKQANRIGVLLTFTVSVMTWWKTVLYLLQYLEVAGGGNYHSHNNFLSLIFLLWIPNGIWIVLPFAVMARLWPHLGVTSPPMPYQPQLLTRKSVRNPVFKKKHY